jgi:hypothetical protein
MSRVRRILVAATFVAALILPSTAAIADPSAPTNGGSANGGGQSGQCTGANADRPASCHNSTGADGN